MKSEANNMWAILLLLLGSQAWAMDITVVTPECKQPTLIEPTRDVSVGERSGNQLETTVPLVPDKTQNSVWGRRDYDGDGVCDAMLAPIPPGYGRGYDFDSIQYYLTLEHGGKLESHKINVRESELRGALALYTPGRPVVLWAKTVRKKDHYVSIIDGKKSPWYFYSWNRDRKRFEELTPEEARPYERHAGMLHYTLIFNGEPVTKDGDLIYSTPPWGHLQLPTAEAPTESLENIASLIEGHETSFDFNAEPMRPEMWSLATRNMALFVLLRWQHSSSGRNPFYTLDHRLSAILGREYRTAPIKKSLDAIGVRNALLLLRELRKDYPKAAELAYAEAIIGMQALDKSQGLLGWKYKSEFPDLKELIRAALQTAREHYPGKEEGLGLRRQIEDAWKVFNAGATLPMPANISMGTIWPMFQETYDWPSHRPKP